MIKNLFIIGILSILIGCATIDEVQNLREEIYYINSQLNKIRNENESLKQDISKLHQKDVETKIPVLEKEVLTLRGYLTGEIKKFQADISLQMETLQSDFRTLSTAIEEYKEYLKRVLVTDRKFENRFNSFEERIKTIEDRFRGQEERSKAMEENLKLLDYNLKQLYGKIDSEIPKKPLEVEKIPEKIIKNRMGDLYKEAYETFQKGEFEKARKKFEAFLKQYPNTELSDNAQFWIGETYFLKKDFEKAILEYEKVILKYPNGDKVPAALLKQGLAFLELGDKTNGLNILRRVIKNYPQSEQAEVAKKKLEGIK